MSKAPIQQTIGWVPFLNCTISINQDVLIPRFETEFLADYVVKELKGKHQGKVLLDLCTGSGCLAIALKKALPELEVIASDISKKALAVAKKNALQNGVEIEFLEGDFLEPLKGRQFDFVISNPPYVTEAEYGVLDDSVRLYEPREALVGGSTGLEFYEKMALQLPSFLNSGGKLFLEIGSTQGEGGKNPF